MRADKKRQQGLTNKNVFCYRFKPQTQTFGWAADVQSLQIRLFPFGLFFDSFGVEQSKCFNFAEDMTEVFDYFAADEVHKGLEDRSELVLLLLHVAHEVV